MNIKFKKLNQDAIMPSYATDGDAGADLYATHSLTIMVGETRAVPTGIAVAIPNGYVGLIHPRSGLAAKHGITVLNAPGTIDAGYRGELKVLLINHGFEPYTINRNDRIAQLVIQTVKYAQFIETEELDSTDRGDGGFGSSGS
jgi:dUTP pyrophosphatase